MATRPGTPTAPAAIPSVFDLARHNCEVWKLASAADEKALKAEPLSAEYREASIAHRQGEEEAQALHALIMSRPISTLPDACALAVHAGLYAEGAASAPTEDDVEILEVAFNRIALVLAGDAGVALTDLGSPGVLRPILQHAGAAPVADSCAPCPDASLIAACDEYVALDVEVQRRAREVEGDRPPPSAAEVEFHRDLHARIVPRRDELVAQITSTTATTNAGILAKAKVSLHFLCADASTDVDDLQDTENALPHSLVMDLLRLLGEAPA